MADRSLAARIHTIPWWVRVLVVTMRDATNTTSTRTHHGVTR